MLGTHEFESFCAVSYSTERENYYSNRNVQLKLLLLLLCQFRFVLTVISTVGSEAAAASVAATAAVAAAALSSPSSPLCGGSSVVVAQGKRPESLAWVQ